VIPPKMPTGFAVGQAILDNEAEGKFDHGVRIIGFRRSDVGGVDGEMLVALTAVMLGIV